MVEPVPGKKRLNELADEDEEEDLDVAAEEVIDQKLKDKLKQAKQRVREAHRLLKKAEEFAASVEEAWMRIRSAIHETRNIAAAWHRMELGDRRVLFSHWSRKSTSWSSGSQG